jgi:riboflavin synthase
MFTGIIEDLGKIESLIRFKDKLVLGISCRFLNELELGDSVSVNGVCLTVSEKTAKMFKADVISESMSKSSLTHLKIGALVNLERAMRANSRFDGHIVSGHVDCRTLITNIVKHGSTHELEISIPKEFEKYTAEKGSIAIDGVSLTIASSTRAHIKVAIIPHTALKTNLFYKKIGDYVNLEFDVLAKYLESIFKNKRLADISMMKDVSIDDEFLKQAGIMN